MELPNLNTFSRNISLATLVADSTEDDNQDDDGSDEQDKERQPVDNGSYFEAAPSVQTTDISFTNMNLSRPLLKVSRYGPHELSSLFSP